VIGTFCRWLPQRRAVLVTSGQCVNRETSIDEKNDVKLRCSEFACCTALHANSDSSFSAVGADSKLS
jgi:hypothetical protein